MEETNQEEELAFCKKHHFFTKPCVYQNFISTSQLPPLVTVIFKQYLKRLAIIQLDSEFLSSYDTAYLNASYSFTTAGGGVQSCEVSLSDRVIYDLYVFQGNRTR